jgi:two-component system, OmpR family, phosphate regulon response regulator OmpR
VPDVNAGPRHILVVDDDDRLRDLLRRFLVDQGFRVTAAGNAAEARQRLDAIAFDLVVLDIMMPGESGLSLARHLSQTSKIPTLLLTAMSEAEHRIRGLEQGADDYLAKPFEPRELVLRINAILRRLPAPSAMPRRIRLGRCEFDLDRTELWEGKARIPLTETEAGLLATLAARAGSILSREDLARNRALAGTERAIDVQVTRLRRKIEPDPKLPRYLQTVRGRGYVLQPD